MKAIQTKTIPATHTKPTRLKATCGKTTLTISAGKLDDLSEIHPGKNGTEDAGKEWLAPFVSGGLESGDFVHVFTK
jgi:hypothetical protein